MKNKRLFWGVCVADALLLAGCIYFYVNQDRTAPVISFGDEEIVYTDGMEEEALLNDVSAYDEQDGDVSYSLLVEKVANTSDGHVVVTYAAKDTSNNVTKSSRILITEGIEAKIETLPSIEMETVSEFVSEMEKHVNQIGRAHV